MSITIESDLKEILGKIENKLENLQKDVSDIKIKVELGTVKTKVEGLEKEVDEVKSEIKELKGTQKNQMWSLITLFGIVVIATLV